MPKKIRKLTCIQALISKNKPHIGRSSSAYDDQGNIGDEIEHKNKNLE
jgi:hypothetical protein